MDFELLISTNHPQLEICQLPKLFSSCMLQTVIDHEQSLSSPKFSSGRWIYIVSGEAIHFSNLHNFTIANVLTAVPRPSCSQPN